MDKNNTNKILFKIWLKNGTCIEKEKVFDDSEADEVLKGLKNITEMVRRAFDNTLDGNVYIDGLIIRISELIAIDIIPILEE